MVVSVTEEDHAALCPRCFYGYRRMTKSGTTYRPTCKKCAAHKKNGRTRRHSSSASASEEVGVAESSQQRNTGTSASTLRPSSGDIISPRPSHRGRAPRGRTWNGREHQPDHPNAPQNVDRRTQPGACRGISRLQADWQTDFPWMHCERDTALMGCDWWSVRYHTVGHGPGLRGMCRLSPVESHVLQTL